VTTVNAVTDDDRPAVEKAAFACPHCNAYAQQTWTVIAERIGTGQYSHVAGFYEVTDEGPVPWMRGHCTKCDHSSLWLNERMVYPTVSTLPIPHPDMPSDVVALYNEARGVAAVSRRAGAAMARATLELLLKTVLPTLMTVPGNASLDDLIVLVEPMVSIAMGTPLMVVRHAGNKSVHVEANPDDVMVLVLDEGESEVMELIFDTVNDLVSELITRKNKMLKYEALIPDGVKQAAERKRAQREQQG
jgi:hypothetical protein